MEMCPRLLLHGALKNPSLDTEFSYSIPGRTVKSTCRVRLYSGVEPAVIIMTELYANEGMSITNSVEYLLPQLGEFLARTKKLAEDAPRIYIEHYSPKDSYGDRRTAEWETFDRVMLLGGRPGWSRLSFNSVFLLLGKG